MSESPAGPLPSGEDRTAAGAEARVKTPPASLGSWSPNSDRVDPIALLESQSTTRLQVLVPVRYGRMAISPFAFYRGAALPMASDLSPGPNSGITVQLCGDAHLSNFGLFASPERALLFDITDFDETLPGPFEFDLKRLAASLVAAGREIGVSGHDARHMVHRAMRSYRERMAGYATMRAIDVYYARVDATGIRAYADKSARGMIKRTVKAAAHHDSVHELPKLTSLIDGKRRLVERPPTLIKLHDMTQLLADSALRAYRETLQENRRVLLDRYRLTDFALKVVGVGSVGLGAFVVLFIGDSDDDPLFLQAKQAEASVYERYLGSGQARQPRRARRHGPASPPGSERHFPRLDRRRTRSTPVRPAAPGPEGQRRHRHDDGR